MTLVVTFELFFEWDNELFNFDLSVCIPPTR